MERKAEGGIKPLSQRESWLSGEIVAIANRIHDALGPGLQKTVYETCFCYALQKRNIPFQKRPSIDITYEEMIFEGALQPDLIVDNLIVVEFKTDARFRRIWLTELTGCMRVANKRIGYLLNFHVVSMKDGIRRKILKMDMYQMILYLLTESLRNTRSLGKRKEGMSL